MQVSIVALTLEYDLGFATMTAASSWATHTNQTIQDGTAGYQNFSLYPVYYGANPRALIAQHSDYDDKVWSQEIRFASKTSGTYDWIGGLFFKDETTDSADHEFYPGYNDYFNACVPRYGAGSLQCGIGEYGPTNNVTKIDGVSQWKRRRDIFYKTTRSAICLRPLVLWWASWSPCPSKGGITIAYSLK